MRARPISLLLAGVVAAGLFAGGTWLYWRTQERHAASYLIQALQANSLQRRQGLAITRVFTSRGWLISPARIDYENPNAWQIAYLNPTLANAMISHQGGMIIRRHGTAPPQRMTAPAAVQAVSTSAGTATSTPTNLGNYNATNLGGATVAGRPVTIIGLVDKGTGRLIRTFWIDNATHIFLRQDLLSPEGRLLSSTEFTNIAFPDKPLAPLLAPPALAPAPQPGPIGVRMDLPRLSRATGFTVRLPQALPAGFRLKESYLLPCPCGCETTSAELHFSDGVRSLSVFEMNARQTTCEVVRSFTALAGKVIPGPSPALKAAVAKRKNIVFVVIGDLPSDRLKQIAASL